MKSSTSRAVEAEALYAKGPVRRGPFYCSPWCGAKCTIVAYDSACFKGKALAEQLGPNWKPRIWENMGWFYAAVDSTGCWKIHVSEHKGTISYTAFLGTPDSPGGKWAEHGATPQEAIEKAKRAARKELRALQAMIDAALVNGKELYLSAEKES
jgi:hypothetical protein